MLIILKGRRASTWRPTLDPKAGAQTTAGQLEELSRRLWAGVISMGEYARLREELMRGRTLPYRPPS